MKKHILLYQDEGASPLCVKKVHAFLKSISFLQDYSIFLVGREMISDEILDISKVALIIFPGGRDIPYHTALQGASNRALFSFIEKGGRFLGICAGAYYGAASIEFEKGTSLEIIQKRELQFFPGVACGPAYGTGIFQYDSEAGAQIAKLSVLSSFHNSHSSSFVPNSVKAYFNGGPFFKEAESYISTTVLCRYEDIKEKPAAIIECQVGAGKALLCGVHLEYSLGRLRKMYLPEEEEFLKQEDIDRKNLFELLIIRLIS